MQVPWEFRRYNLLSFVRLIATVPLVWSILLATHASLFAAAILFVVMAITDTVDGRLARRYGWVSNIGDLSRPDGRQGVHRRDPGCDGGGTLIRAMDRDRDHCARIYRHRRALVCRGRGHGYPADRWGKYKMLLTIIAIAWMLVWASAGLAPRSGLSPLVDPNGLLAMILGLGYWLMIGAVLLTIYSGYDLPQKGCAAVSNLNTRAKVYNKAEMSDARDPEAVAAALQHIADEVDRCTACALHQGRTRAVPGAGRSTPRLCSSARRPVVTGSGRAGRLSGRPDVCWKSCWPRSGWGVRTCLLPMW